MLWLFLRFFSKHRFDLGRSKSAVLQFPLIRTLICLIWTFLDVFIIAGVIRSSRDQVRERATRGLYDERRSSRRAPCLIEPHRRSETSYLAAPGLGLLHAEIVAI